jgi:hypothetical protein
MDKRSHDVNLLQSAYCTNEIYATDAFYEAGRLRPILAVADPAHRVSKDLIHAPVKTDDGQIGGRQRQAKPEDRDSHGYS